jgi:hypothetical protein
MANAWQSSRIITVDAQHAACSEYLLTANNRTLLTLAIWLLALVPRVAIILQPIPVQLDKTLPDDAYYYFLTAENILNGRGASVDGIHASNGWHPLWMLVNLAIFTLPVSDLDGAVRLALLAGALLDSLVAVILYRALRPHLGDPAALVGAGLYVVNHMVAFQAVNGLETGLSALLIACAWTTTLALVNHRDTKRAILWGLSFGLCFLGRTDTALILLWLGLYALLTLPPDRHWRLLLPGAATALVIVAPWLLWNQVNFGSAFVQTSSIAVPWAAQTRFMAANPDAPLWRLSLDVFTAPQYWLRGDYLGAPILMGFLLWPLALWGMWRAYRSAARQLAQIALLLLVGGATLVFVHTMLRWYPRPWYFVVMAQSLCIGVALFWNAVASPRVRAVLLALGLVGSVVFGLIAWQVGYYPWQAAHMYDAALWIRDNTPEDTLVGSMNSGIIGYYSQRPTINLDGVVNPQAFAASQQGRLMEYIQVVGIRYFLDFDYALEREYGPFMGPGYRQALTEVAQIGPGYNPLGLYRIYTVGD